jgi:hypothetical protein
VLGDSRLRDGGVIRQHSHGLLAVAAQGSKIARRPGSARVLKRVSRRCACATHNYMAMDLIHNSKAMNKSRGILSARKFEILGGGHGERSLDLQQRKNVLY